VYAFVDQAGQAGLIDELIASCEAMGLPLDTAHAEFTDMLEVGLSPCSGVRVADNAALYKAVAKLVAARHGAYISFMARRSGTEQGCGAHINVSLKDPSSGKGLFYDEQSEHRLTPPALHFIGGLLRYLPELFLLLAPNLNSYKRFVPGIFTPLNNSWSINNRTVALRVSNETPGATRVEVRPAGADVSPHLALLAVCLAGRLGLEEKIEPPAPLTGNGWEVEETGSRPLPLTFEAAIQAFETSKVARDHLGDGFVNDFVGDRKWQRAALAGTVTDWEIRTFGNL
jgi:glutamine synthetase